MNLDGTNIDDIVNYEEEYGKVVKKSKIQGSKMTGCCPFHNDKNPSFSVDLENGKWICFAGCGSGNYVDLVAKLNDISTKEAYKKILRDNNIEQPKKKNEDKYKHYTVEQYCGDKKIPVDFLKKKFYVSDATYCRTQCVKMPYLTEDGTEHRCKMRFANKQQCYNSGPGKGLILYGEWLLPEIRKDGYVFLVEGESDTQSLWYMGIPALGVPGAEGFNVEMAEKLKDIKEIYIHCEGDAAGNKFAFQTVPKQLKEVGYSGIVGVLKCRDIESAIKDPSDLLIKYDKYGARNKISELLRSNTKNINLSEIEVDDGLKMTPMSAIEEKEPEWLIPGYVPKGSIVSLAGDGGTGKTSIWCSIAAAISGGEKTFLEKDVPGDFGSGEPQKVMFFSAEDSTEHVLIKKLKGSGANLNNIITIGISDKRFNDVKFNNPFLGDLIKKYKPALCIFDPIQAFVPPTIRMGDRNAMRNCMEPLIAYGEKYGTTFLIIEHTNKQSGVWGRKRIADSADIWDISRSVLVVGETKEKGIFYLSHEKSNLSERGSSVLYSIADGGSIRLEGYTDKRDRDFVSEADRETRMSPQKEEAIEFILDYLRDGDKKISELYGAANAMGITSNAIKAAKVSLNKDGRIKTWNTGFGKDKTYYISLAT